MDEEIRKQKARENARRYYQKNKEKVLAKQKEYVKKKYATDEEFRKKCYKRSRKYAENNIEKIRESKRRWANKHYKELREKGLLPPSKKEIIKILQQRVEQLEKENKELKQPQVFIDCEDMEERYGRDLYEDYLKGKIEQLENIIKEAIEYLTSYESINTIQQVEQPENNEGLDEDTFVEMVHRYMEVHHNLLNILNKGSDL